MQSSLLNQRFSLLANSGVQFLDCPLPPDIGNDMRYFVRHKANGPLVRAVADPHQAVFRLPALAGAEDEIVRPEYQLPLSDCLECYAGVWLPVPFLRASPSGHCAHGPVNWVRVFVTQPSTPDEPRMLTLAFDTTTGNALTRHLQPDMTDCDNGQCFIPGWEDQDIGAFLELSWLSDWVAPVFHQQNSATVVSSLRFCWQAHYLNLLEIIGSALPCHGIVLLPADHIVKPVAVDLFLDPGNSHTCGIISEIHQSDENPLLHSRELMLRDLSRPGEKSSVLFSSNIAFAPCPLDVSACSVASGRSSAFLWPSLVRTGNEATRLTRELNRSGGLQGVSSPRRYLWDDSPGINGWYYPATEASQPRQAVQSPFTLLINDQAELLRELSADQQFPVFHGHYPRSSLMMFMLCELISQAFCQMNSHHHRQQMPEYSAPRQLRSVILTLPAAISAPEKEKVLALTRQALNLIRQTMTYSTDASRRRAAGDYWQNMPLVRADVDEASCGQLMWLYNQLYDNPSATNPGKQLLEKWQRGPGEQPRSGLRIALIDIGGGTTDVSVTDYQPAEYGSSAPLVLRPSLHSRAGYPLAGEDLLYDIIKVFLLPALQQHLIRQGFTQAGAITRQLFSPGASSEGDTPWRQQFVRQFFRPLAIRILGYSQQLTADGQAAVPLYAAACELLPRLPDRRVTDYFALRVAEMSGNRSDCALAAMIVSVSPQQLEDFFQSEHFRAGRLLSLISDNVTKEQPDLLLFSGKIAALPAIRRLLSHQSQLPESHIISLDGISANESIPFCRNGVLADGKCSAITGALIHQLTRHQRLYPRYLAAGQLRPGNNIREFGPLNAELMLPASQVVLRLPAVVAAGAEFMFTLFLPLRLTLGYRASGDELLPASPLLILFIDPAGRINDECDDGVNVTLCWKADNEGQFSQLPEVVEVTDHQQTPLPASLVCVRLNSLATHGEQSPAYWTDDGRIAVTGSPPASR